jgi:hypothetical protein
MRSRVLKCLTILAQSELQIYRIRDLYMTRSDPVQQE